VPAIVPFQLEVPDAELDDLRSRLRSTRWPDPEPVSDWSQGIPLAYLKELCRYWGEEYDWRAAERRLDEVGQFRTEIDGLGIHFLHRRSSHPDALPLVLTHGWPGSVVEFLKVIGPLTEPTRFGGSASDAFHVVCPSLPGFGFSDKPTTTGWDVDRIAAAWAELMSRLGYEHYGAQGGDWGSEVTTSLARADPDHVVGVHVNMVFISPDDIAKVGTPNADEQAALAAIAEYRRSRSGYARQQATRPQTLGYGLADSPAGQCAWIVEKFWDWSDCDGDPLNVFTRDELLDNVMLYWLPDTATSSARLYWETYGTADTLPVEVPAGVSTFPRELFPAPRRWVAQRFRDLRHYGEPPRGGHFAAFERPELFVDEVRAFFRHVRPA
jgi:pimeloyl-ACP methyl ester carboxylesterase